jgi:hypothetical protein
MWPNYCRRCFKWSLSLIFSKICCDQIIVEDFLNEVFSLIFSKIGCDPIIVKDFKQVFSLIFSKIRCDQIIVEDFKRSLFIDFLENRLWPDYCRRRLKRSLFIDFLKKLAVTKLLFIDFLIGCDQFLVKCFFNEVFSLIFSKIDWLLFIDFFTNRLWPISCKRLLTTSFQWFFQKLTDYCSLIFSLIGCERTDWLNYGVST